jgi:hypothetical protein
VDQNHQVVKLVAEAGNAKAWIAKFSSDLKLDPDNENLKNLLELATKQFESRVNALTALGADYNEGVM